MKLGNWEIEKFTLQTLVRRSFGEIEKEKGITKSILKKSLESSSKSIESLLENPNGKVKSFKPHATAFFGYLLAHEGHHRGQILLCLKQSGQMVDKKILAMLLCYFDYNENESSVIELTANG